MSNWLISLEGTEQGHTVALILALMAAVLHALFGALQKGRHDPWLSRAAIDICYGLMALPASAFRRALARAAYVADLCRGLS